MESSGHDRDRCESSLRRCTWLWNFGWISSFADPDFVILSRKTATQVRGDCDNDYLLLRFYMDDLECSIVRGDHAKFKFQTYLRLALFWKFPGSWRQQIRIGPPNRTGSGRIQGVSLSDWASLLTCGRVSCPGRLVLISGSGLVVSRLDRASNHEKATLQLDRPLARLRQEDARCCFREGPDKAWMFAQPTQSMLLPIHIMKTGVIPPQRPGLLTMFPF